MKTLMKLTRKELLKIAKPMVVNLQVAKTIGDKSQTRRIAKINPIEPFNIEDNIKEIIEKHSRWRVGDILWIREPARVSMINIIYSGELLFEYAADDNLDITDKKYQSNLHKIKMPERFTKGCEVTAKWIINKKGVPNGCIKEMARTFLKITSVRVERLQDISYEDIMAEGCDIDISDCITYDGQEQEEAVSHAVYSWFIDLWNSTAPKGYKWEDNPYVFVYEFEKIEEVA